MAAWLREMSVGEWYRPLEGTGDPFEVVGFDAAAEVVLVQHYDGTLEEFDFETWTELRAVACAPPEDYSGALDLDRDDYGLDLESRHPHPHENPLDLIEQRDL